MVERLQLETCISKDTKAIMAVQVQLKSRKLSKTLRDKLEAEIRNRVHMRYVAIHALRQLGQ